MLAMSGLRVLLKYTALKPTQMIDMDSPTGLRKEYYIDQFWCDAGGMYFQGWIHCYEHPIKALRIEIGQDTQRVSEFSKRQDLLNFFPDYPHVVDGGFQVFVPSLPGEYIYFVAETDAGELRFRHEVARREDKSVFEDDGLPPSNAFREFVTYAASTTGTVLELGARSVAPGRRPFRNLFGRAAKYIGVDLYEDANVDVVGDAHYLSNYVEKGSVDFIFSLSVIEHLQCPWLVIAELNRVLRLGGEVFVNVPHSWPIHEAPNDFWRFSDEGLKVLFGPNLGFEVVKSGLEDEVYIYPDNRGGPLAMLPLQPGYCRAFIHARKVSELAADTVKWPLEQTSSAELADRYPKPLISASSADG